MTSPPTFDSQNSLSPSVTALRAVGEFFLQRRVRITAIVFAMLILEDFLEGLKPHGLENIYDWKSMLGLSLVVSGLALRSWAAGTLHKKSLLTTYGPYSMVRHPLYIGSFLMMLGFCELIDDAENIWFILGPTLLLYIYRAISEERFLAGKFSAQWEAYARAVPRFIPRRLPIDALRYWDATQWFRNREYNSVSAAFLGLIAVQLWHMS